MKSLNELLWNQEGFEKQIVSEAKEQEDQMNNIEKLMMRDICLAPSCGNGGGGIQKICLGWICPYR